jgi:hypothetical protein
MAYLAVLTTAAYVPEIVLAKSIDTTLISVLLKLVIRSALDVFLTNDSGELFQLPLPSKVNNIPIYNVKL